MYIGKPRKLFFVWYAALLKKKVVDEGMGIYSAVCAVKQCSPLALNNTNPSISWLLVKAEQKN